MNEERVSPNDGGSSIENYMGNNLESTTHDNEERETEPNEMESKVKQGMAGLTK